MRKIFVTSSKDLNFITKIAPPSVHYVSPGLKSDAFLVHHCKNEKSLNLYLVFWQFWRKTNLQKDVMSQARNFKNKMAHPSVHYVSPGLKSDAFLDHLCSNNHRQIQTRHRICVVEQTNKQRPKL